MDIEAKIEKMKQTECSAITIADGWHLKEINNFSQFEIIDSNAENAKRFKNVDEIEQFILQKEFEQVAEEHEPTTEKDYQ